MLDRRLSSCEHKFVRLNCKKCGIYNYGENEALKTNLYESTFHSQSQKYLSHLRSRQTCPTLCSKITDETWHLLESICEKFEFSTETLALGIYIGARTQAQSEDYESVH